MKSIKSHSKLFLCASAAIALAGFTAGAQNANPNALGHVERANKVYGKQVMSSDNQKVGNLNNLIIDLECLLSGEAPKLARQRIQAATLAARALAPRHIAEVIWALSLRTLTARPRVESC